MKESNVEMVWGFSEEEGVEDLKIEPKLHVVTTS
jgi:preprotein translocase subunit Sec61beta